MKTQKCAVNQQLTATLKESSMRNFRNVCIHSSCMAILLAFYLSGCNTISDRKYPVTLSVDVPEYTETNDAISKKIFKLLMATHTTCGLDAEGFHQNIARLQEVVAGNGFESVADGYIVAARLCHDAKIKPSKYKASDSRSREDVTEITVSPGASATGVQAGKDGVKLGSISVSVPISRKKSLSSTEQAMKEIEYAQNVYATAESLNKIQALEDAYFKYFIKSLKSHGYTNLTVNDFIGKWLLKTGDFLIVFKLNRDMTMEAERKLSGIVISTTKEDYATWGDGIWSLEGKVLEIVNKRAGLNRFINQKYECTWVSGEVTCADENKIIVKGDGGTAETQLLRQ